MPLILIVLLLDSRLDQSIKRIKNLHNKYQSIETFSEKNKMWRHIPENSIILTDRWNELFHAPTGVRIHSAECNLQADFLNRCNPEEVQKIHNYNFAILINQKDNPCYQMIKANSSVIDRIDDYELYKIK